MPEAKTAKNRVHLDVRVASGPAVSPEQQALIEEHAARLVEAGGTVLRRQREQGLCVVMQDPEGNEFCLTLSGCLLPGYGTAR